MSPGTYPQKAQTSKTMIHTTSPVPDRGTWSCSSHGNVSLASGPLHLLFSANTAPTFIPFLSYLQGWPLLIFSYHSSWTTC